MEQKTGIIYELRCNIEGEWHPFYVGQTGDPKRRIGEHRRDAKNADAESTLVYRNIKEHLNANDIEWDMFEVAKFTEADEGSWEDEHIVRLLLSGAKLWNSKKGSANWLAERQTWADDMRVRGITSFKKYKEVLTLEEHNRKIAEQNAKRIAEEQRLQRLEEARKQEELAREEYIKQLKIKRLEREARMTAEQLAREEAKRIADEQRAKERAEQEAKQAIQREKTMKDMLAAAERARIDREQMEKIAKQREAEREAKWLAEAPMREARLRAETERLEREEAERLAAKQKRMAEVDARIAQHEEQEKIREQQEMANLLRARQRLLKIVMKP